MTNRRRSALASEATVRNLEQLARLGGEIRRSRLARRMTQAQLGRAVGLHAMTIGRLERGQGGGSTLDAWQRVGVALGRPLRVDLETDREQAPADAGHLLIQELVLRLGRAAGYTRSFELATRPQDPRGSTDVGLRNDQRRILVLAECWNTIGDVGGAARSTARKRAEAQQYAVAIGHGSAYRVASVWIMRATRRNRALVARYPEVFSARFPGSSLGWVAALTQGTEPPSEMGLVWSDVACSRIYAWRRR